jgi:hypothetical protein
VRACLFGVGSANQLHVLHCSLLPLDLIVVKGMRMLRQTLNCLYLPPSGAVRKILGATRNNDDTARAPSAWQQRIQLPGCPHVVQDEQHFPVLHKIFELPAQHRRTVSCLPRGTQAPQSCSQVLCCFLPAFTILHLYKGAVGKASCQPVEQHLGKSAFATPAYVHIQIQEAASLPRCTSQDPQVLNMLQLSHRQDSLQMHLNRRTVHVRAMCLQNQSQLRTTTMPSCQLHSFDRKTSSMLLLGAHTSTVVT